MVVGNGCLSMYVMLLVLMLVVISFLSLCTVLDIVLLLSPSVAQIIFSLVILFKIQMMVEVDSTARG